MMFSLCMFLLNWIILMVILQTMGWFLENPNRGCFYNRHSHTLVHTCWNSPILHWSYNNTMKWKVNKVAPVTFTWHKHVYLSFKLNLVLHILFNNPISVLHWTFCVLIECRDNLLHVNLDLKCKFELKMAFGPYVKHTTASTSSCNRDFFENKTKLTIKPTLASEALLRENKKKSSEEMFPAVGIEPRPLINRWFQHSPFCANWACA